MSNRRRLVRPMLTPEGLLLPTAARPRPDTYSRVKASTRAVVRLRNTESGEVFLCHYADCEKPANAKIDVVMAHPQPQHPDDTLIYIFCTDDHRARWLARRPASV